MYECKHKLSIYRSCPTNASKTSQSHLQGRKGKQEQTYCWVSTAQRQALHLTLTATDILCTSKLFHGSSTPKALVVSQRGEWQCWQEVMQTDRKADGLLVWLWQERGTGIQAGGVKGLWQAAANTRSTNRFSLGSVCWPHHNNKFSGIKTLGNVLAKRQFGLRKIYDWH